MSMLRIDPCFLKQFTVYVPLKHINVLSKNISFKIFCIICSFLLINIMVIIAVNNGNYIDSH